VGVEGGEEYIHLVAGWPHNETQLNNGEQFSLTQGMKMDVSLV